MNFNPIFFQSLNDLQGLADTGKFQKLSNKSYLFSDIIKVCLNKEKSGNITSDAGSVKDMLFRMASNSSPADLKQSVKNYSASSKLSGWELSEPILYLKNSSGEDTSSNKLIPLGFSGSEISVNPSVRLSTDLTTDELDTFLGKLLSEINNDSQGQYQALQLPGIKAEALGQAGKNYEIFFDTQNNKIIINGGELKTADNAAIFDGAKTADEVLSAILNNLTNAGNDESTKVIPLSSADNKAGSSLVKIEFSRDETESYSQDEIKSFIVAALQSNASLGVVLPKEDGSKIEIEIENPKQQADVVQSAADKIKTAAKQAAGTIPKNNEVVKTEKDVSTETGNSVNQNNTNAEKEPVSFFNFKESYKTGNENRPVTAPNGNNSIKTNYSSATVAKGNNDIILASASETDTTDTMLEALLKDAAVNLSNDSNTRTPEATAVNGNVKNAGSAIETSLPDKKEEANAASTGNAGANNGPEKTGTMPDAPKAVNAAQNKRQSGGENKPVNDQPAQAQQAKSENKILYSVKVTSTNPKENSLASEQSGAPGKYSFAPEYKSPVIKKGDNAGIFVDYSYVANESGFFEGDFSYGGSLKRELLNSGIKGTAEVKTNTGGQLPLVDTTETNLSDSKITTSVSDGTEVKAGAEVSEKQPKPAGAETTNTLTGAETANALTNEKSVVEQTATNKLSGKNYNKTAAPVVREENTSAKEKGIEFHVKQNQNGIKTGADVKTKNVFTQLDNVNTTETTDVNYSAAQAEDETPAVNAENKSNAKVQPEAVNATAGKAVPDTVENVKAEEPEKALPQNTEEVKAPSPEPFKMEGELRQALQGDNVKENGGKIAVGEYAPVNEEAAPKGKENVKANKDVDVTDKNNVNDKNISYKNKPAETIHSSVANTGETENSERADNVIQTKPEVKTAGKINDEESVKNEGAQNRSGNDIQVKNTDEREAEKPAANEPAVKEEKGSITKNTASEIKAETPVVENKTGGSAAENKSEIKTPKTENINGKQTAASNEIEKKAETQVTVENKVKEGTAREVKETENAGDKKISLAEEENVEVKPEKSAAAKEEASAVNMDEEITLPVKDEERNKTGIKEPKPFETKTAETKKAVKADSAPVEKDEPKINNSEQDSGNNIKEYSAKKVETESGVVKDNNTGSLNEPQKVKEDKITVETIKTKTEEKAATQNVNQEELNQKPEILQTAHEEKNAPLNNKNAVQQERTMPVEEKADNFIAAEKPESRNTSDVKTQAAEKPESLNTDDVKTRVTEKADNKKVENSGVENQNLKNENRQYSEIEINESGNNIIKMSRQTKNEAGGNIRQNNNPVSEVKHESVSDNQIRNENEYAAGELNNAQKTYPANYEKNDFVRNEKYEPVETVKNKNDEAGKEISDRDYEKKSETVKTEQKYTEYSSIGGAADSIKEKSGNAVVNETAFANTKEKETKTDNDKKTDSPAKETREEKTNEVKRDVQDRGDNQGHGGQDASFTREKHANHGRTENQPAFNIENRNTDQTAFVKERAHVETGRYENSYKTVKAPEIMKEISDFISKGETKSIVLKIDPENLGKVKIVVEMADKVVNANIEVENENVKKAVLNNIDNLKNSLAQEGVQLNSVNVNLPGYEQKNPKQAQPKRKASSGYNEDETVDEAKNRDVKNRGYNTYEYVI